MLSGDYPLHSGECSRRASLRHAPVLAPPGDITDSAHRVGRRPDPGSTHSSGGATRTNGHPNAEARGERVRS